MLTPWPSWVHLMCSTRGTWLPGDPRGFRDHDHRVHSSGDYKRPPPVGEHAKLHAYAKRINGKVVYLTPVQQRRIGEAIVAKLDLMQMPWRALAVGSSHVHLLARVERDAAKTAFGQVKQSASHAVRDELPGSIWGEGCLPVQVRDERHYHTLVAYILEHAVEGAWVMEHPTVVARRLRGTL